MGVRGEKKEKEGLNCYVPVLTLQTISLVTLGKSLSLSDIIFHINKMFMLSIWSCKNPIIVRGISVNNDCIYGLKK